MNNIVLTADPVYIYGLGQISLHSCLEQAYSNYFNKNSSGIVKDGLNMILLCYLNSKYLRFCLGKHL